MKPKKIYKPLSKNPTTMEKAARALALKGPKHPFLVTIIAKKTVDAVDELQAKEIIESDITEYNQLEKIYTENTEIKEITKLT